MLEDIGECFVNNVSELYYAFVGTARHVEVCPKAQGVTNNDTTYGHFTHEPKAVTMKLREVKRKCPKAVPTHPSKITYYGHGPSNVV